MASKVTAESGQRPGHAPRRGPGTGSSRGGRGRDRHPPEAGQRGPVWLLWEKHGFPGRSMPLVCCLAWGPGQSEGGSASWGRF